MKQKPLNQRFSDFWISRSDEFFFFLTTRSSVTAISFAMLKKLPFINIDSEKKGHFNIFKYRKDVIIRNNPKH